MRTVLTLCLSLLAASAFAENAALSLDDTIAFSSSCGNIIVKGEAAGYMGSYFHPVNLSLTNNKGRPVLNIDELAIPADHMSMICMGSSEADKQLVISTNCTAHAEVCTKTWFYIINAKSGAIVAPKNLKSEKSLCDAKCADKATGSSYATDLEKENL